jgi:hypothetical protein
MNIRPLLIVSAFLLAGLTGPALSQPPQERNTDRPGNDYRDFDIAGTSNACQSICLKDGRCQAWTYVKPGVQARSARCWLKDREPRPVANPCCTSGTRSQRFD